MGLALHQLCPRGGAARNNPGATHVDVGCSPFSDAGSIPAASTNPALPGWRRSRASVANSSRFALRARGRFPPGFPSVVVASLRSLPFLGAARGDSGSLGLLRIASLAFLFLRRAKSYASGTIIDRAASRISMVIGVSPRGSPSAWTSSGGSVVMVVLRVVKWDRWSAFR